MSEPVVVERRRSAVVAIVAVVAGIVALALLWFFVISPLLGGDEDDDDLVVPVAGPQATPSPAAEPDAELPAATPSPQITEPEQGEAVPIETFELVLSRDPFRPVRPAAEEPAAPGEPGPVEPGAPGGPGTPTPTPTGTLPPTDGEPADGDRDRARVEGREVVLIDVFVQDGRNRAVVQVDGRAFEVGEGDTFADNFRVLSIDPPCVTLLFGDDAFTLCEGERVLK